jgi:hypothetical protein
MGRRNSPDDVRYREPRLLGEVIRELIEQGALAKEVKIYNNLRRIKYESRQ